MMFFSRLISRPCQRCLHGMLLGILACGISACGQKGPLVLPVKPGPQMTPIPTTPVTTTPAPATSSAPVNHIN